MMYKKHKQYRLPGFDYAGEGNYFVTICTHNRNEYFGKIIQGKMILTDAGKIADKIWNEIPNKFENVKLDVYQIMPDHLHGIIIIKSDNRRNLTRLPDGQVHQIPNKKNFINEKNFVNEIPTGNEFRSGIRNNPMELKSISLGRILRWFKGRVKYETNKIIPGFKWQSRFYDRIIRNDKEFYFIGEYIINNPLNWGNEILENYFNEIS